MSAEGEDEEFAGYIVEYDPSKGEVVERFNGNMKAAIQIRANLLDKAIRYAAIRELEKLGYTIFAPDNGEAP
jgi:hypothetical protein